MPELTITSPLSSSESTPTHLPWTTVCQSRLYARVDFMPGSTVFPVRDFFYVANNSLSTSVQGRLVFVVLNNPPSTVSTKPITDWSASAKLCSFQVDICSLGIRHISPVLVVPHLNDFSREFMVFNFLPFLTKKINHVDVDIGSDRWWWVSPLADCNLIFIADVVR